MSLSRTSCLRWVFVVVAATIISAWAFARYHPWAVGADGMVEDRVAVVVEDSVEVVEASGFTPHATEVAASLASGPAPFYGFCPTDTSPIERPSLAAVVNERLDELADRARTLLEVRQVSTQVRRGLSRLYSKNSSTEETADAIAILRDAPGRVDDGFDYAAAAAMVLAARALRSDRHDEALQWARVAARDDPTDTAPYVIQAIVARRRSDDVGTREALRGAFERAPTDPAIALAMGQSFSSTAELSLALRGLSTYLSVVPEDAMISGLEARVEIRVELTEDFRQRSRLGVTVLWSPEVNDDLGEQAHEAVIEALDSAAALLGVPRRQELTLFVYSARADLLAATCVQSWARAAYDGALHLDGEGLAQPGVMERHISHESLHAQLAAVAPNAPVWLHEGLAQYFARQHSTRHERSYRFMIEQQTWVPFASLGGSFQVITDSSDAQLAYHQSLAMVELLIHRRGEAVLHEAVTFLQQGGEPRELFDHLAGTEPITGQDLLLFLQDQRLSAE